MTDHPVDVILSDISMPVMDGISLAKTLYEQNTSVILVFLSGYAEFEYARQALTYKVYEYILKPIKSDELHTVFRRISEQLNQSGSNSDTGSYYDKLIPKSPTLYGRESVIYYIKTNGHTRRPQSQLLIQYL